MVFGVEHLKNNGKFFAKINILINISDMKSTVETRTYIYVISDRQGRFKIGRSDNPEKRLRQLQTGNSKKLEIIGITKGDIWLEKRLHKMFLLHREKGEWFSLSPEAVEFLLDYLRTKDLRGS